MRKTASVSPHGLPFSRSHGDAGGSGPADSRIGTSTGPADALAELLPYSFGLDATEEQLDELGVRRTVSSSSSRPRSSTEKWRKPCRQPRRNVSRAKRSIRLLRDILTRRVVQCQQRGPE